MKTFPKLNPAPSCPRTQRMLRAGDNQTDTRALPLHVATLGVASTQNPNNLSQILEQCPGFWSNTTAHHVRLCSPCATGWGLLHQRSALDQVPRHFVLHLI